MTVSSVNLVSLRSAKNAVIGNPSAKLQLARDRVFVTNLVDCLNYPDACAKTRIEAAHVVASLSYGSDEALLALLRGHAHHALLYALARFTKDDSLVLRAAFARALRALATSAADAVGPSQWGLGPASNIAKHDSRDALDFFFLPESLDTLLPLLVDTASQVSTSIAQLLASAIRIQHHRIAVSEWMPPADRTKAKEKDIKPRRGWEKVAVGPGPARLGGWTVRQLVALMGSRDIKLQEAALGALGALAKENTDVASALTRPTIEREASPLTSILNLTKSRSPDLQLAACLCAVHIVRALPRHQQDEHSTRIVMNTVNRMIASPLSPTEDLGTPHTSTGTSSSHLGNLGQVTLAQRTRACFVLYHLVADDASLCQAAFERGCLAQLVGLVTALPLPPTPPSLVSETESLAPGTGSGQGGHTAGAGVSRVYTPPEDEVKAVEEEEWREPDARALLREAALTTIAALSLFDNDVQRSLTEPNSFPSYHHPSSFPAAAAAAYTSTSTILNSSFSPSPSPPAASTSTSTSGAPSLIPVLRAGLAHPSPGVRFAACQCVRAMSRAIAVLRTNIVDSELGVGVWRRCVKGRATRKSPPAAAEARGDAGGRGFGFGFGFGFGEKEKEEGEGEGEGEGEKDKRVLGAGLAVVCNLVNNFSPLCPVLLEDGLVERLVEIMGYDEPLLRINALWALKNLLYRSELDLKKRVMKEVGWSRVLGFLDDPDIGIREQALNVLSNLTEDEDGVQFVTTEVREDVILNHIANALKSANDDITFQAASLLANLTNDTDAPLQARILSHPQILPALHAALVAATITAASSPPSAAGGAHAHAHAPRVQVRGPLVSCVAQLAAAGAAQVQGAGFEGALRHVCEWAGGGLGGGRGVNGGWDEVAEKARQALGMIERGGAS
ncbi:hypothetical protein C0993_010107 [Termitomyces sp. T159_Od127]|nr:hypothetical protein C0993_010107 [Termitomyces sp. T159_Od127]